MDVKVGAERFDQAVSAFPEHIRATLTAIPQQVKARVFEVRLRVGRPVSLYCPDRVWFVDRYSQLHNIARHCFVVTPGEIADTVVRMCAYSVHSHQDELRSGFLCLKGGHRAGICGTAVISGGKITAVRDITSINLRVAREIKGAAAALVERAFRNGLCGVLIAGAPSSGKTTILRDLIRQLGDGETGRYVKVAVVDERGEIGAVYEGIPQNDLGATSDILTGYPKGTGILAAVRTLSPHVIVCDEIGSRAEADSMLDGIHCGVKMIATAHAGSLDELLLRPQILRLLRHGAFDRIVQLGSADTPGTITEIIEVGELELEADRNSVGDTVLDDDGDVHGLRIVEEGAANRAGHRAGWHSARPASIFATDDAAPH